MICKSWTRLTCWESKQRLAIVNSRINYIVMGGSSAGHGVGGTCPTPPRFLEANLKSLIFTIGAPQIYNLRLLSPTDFNAYSSLCILYTLSQNHRSWTYSLGNLKFKLQVDIRIRLIYRKQFINGKYDIKKHEQITIKVL